VHDALPPLPVGFDYCVVARAHDSLPRHQRWALFGALAGVSLSIAVAFALAGAWPVLPYSAVEIGMVGLAFWLVERRAEDWERLSVAGDRVLIERQLRGRRDRREFNRCWLRVEFDPGGFGRRARVTLHSAGNAVDFGGAMSVAEMHVMARELRRIAGLR
jgi:uncharacterized membrane protein